MSIAPPSEDYLRNAAADPSTLRRADLIHARQIADTEGPMERMCQVQAEWTLREDGRLTDQVLFSPPRHLSAGRLRRAAAALRRAILYATPARADQLRRRLAELEEEIHNQAAACDLLRELEAR